MTRRLSLTQLSVASVLSGILYNSWPIGYFLNLPVAQRGLASELEISSQPYHQLFVGADLVSSGILLLLLVIFFRRSKAHLEHVTHVRLALVSVGIFAVGTIVDALLPMTCAPSVQVCPTFMQDHRLLLHGLISILGSGALLIALFFLQRAERRSTVARSMLIIYSILSAYAFVSLFIPQAEHLAEQIYLIFCGVWIAVLPYTMSKQTITSLA